MKKMYKISSFLILLFCLFLLPYKVDALAVGVNTIEEDVGYLVDDYSQMQFSNIKYKDFSDSTVAPTFGFTGIVYNGGTSDNSFIATAKFYAEDKELIATIVSNQVVPAGEKNSYSQVANVSEIRSGYSVKDIRYYHLEIIITNNTYGLNPTEYRGREYVIDNYDVNIDVKENNVLEITEKIGAYFNVEKHGIFRKIPLRNKVQRLDGSYYYNRVKISDIFVDNEYTLSNEAGYKVIKIGSSYATLKGHQDYTIRYKYNLGRDPGKDYDELYFDLIGTEWDTIIENVNFTINMPKEFDKEKLGFASGVAGSSDSSNIKYEVNGNVITGSVEKSLNTGEGLTVRLELPEGYFSNASSNLDVMMIIALLGPILCLVIAISLWFIYGKDNKPVETIEFYPPKDFNSLEVGYAFRGRAENQDAVSLLIYLANKGYIKIAENEGKKDKSFKIIKIKEYDGNNINERIFLNDLFKGGKTEVTESDLQDSFYITINEILSNMNSKNNKEQYFEKKASSKTIIIVLMMIITFCLITIPPLYYYGDMDTILIALIFPGVGLAVMLTLLFGGPRTMYVNGKATYSNWGTKIFGLVWGTLFGGMPWAFTVLPALLIDYIYAFIYVVGIICFIGMTICLVYLPKRTKYGTEILGKLLGFKTFLETAEKNKLEAMVMENPTYFYDILPYTYVLGVSNKWIKKFEGIAMQPPTWYDSPDVFTVHSFNTFIDNTMTSARDVMSSSPSTSSGSDSFGGGGFSSGGGFSGGGSGGGGGGSW